MCALNLSNSTLYLQCYGPVRSLPSMCSAAGVNTVPPKPRHMYIYVCIHMYKNYKKYYDSTIALLYYIKSHPSKQTIPTNKGWHALP